MIPLLPSPGPSPKPHLSPLKKAANPPSKVSPAVSDLGPVLISLPTEILGLPVNAEVKGIALCEGVEGVKEANDIENVSVGFVVVVELEDKIEDARCSLNEEGRTSDKQPITVPLVLLTAFEEEVELVGFKISNISSII